MSCLTSCGALANDIEGHIADQTCARTVATLLATRSSQENSLTTRIPCNGMSHNTSLLAYLQNFCQQLQNHTDNTDSMRLLKGRGPSKGDQEISRARTLTRSSLYFMIRSSAKPKPFIIHQLNGAESSNTGRSSLRDLSQSTLNCDSDATEQEHQSQSHERAVAQVLIQQRNRYYHTVASHPYTNSANPTQPQPGMPGMQCSAV